MLIASKLLNAATATGAGAFICPQKPRKAFTVTGRTTAGAGAAVVLVQVSNDNVAYTTIGSISLPLSTVDFTDVFATDQAFKYFRLNIDSISGTGANVDGWIATP